LENKSGSRDKSRVQLKLAIEVVNIEFDAEQCSLRLNGINRKESEHIKLGQYHTIEIELHRPVELKKHHWDSVYMEVLDDARDPTKKAEIAAIVMQEGLASICLIKSSLTKVCAKIERTIPKKKEGNKSFTTATNKFFDDIYTSLKRCINFDFVKVVLIGSPGFLSEDFWQYVMDRAVKEVDTSLLKNKAKFIRTHTSYGHKRAIDEMLQSSDLAAQLADVKAADEVRALHQFYDTFSSDPDRACYGFNDVAAANEQLAIAELLISDKLYRSDNYSHRKKYIALMDSVKANHGKVFKFSSLHASGEQLNLYTGIAATLRFPLPDIAEEEEHDETN